MAEQDVINFKRAYLHMKINNMKRYVASYKESINTCDPVGISSSATSIGELREKLRNDKQYLNDSQEKEIDSLEREHAIQFQRLNLDKVCECKPRPKR